MSLIETFTDRGGGGGAERWGVWYVIMGLNDVNVIPFDYKDPIVRLAKECRGKVKGQRKYFFRRQRVIEQEIIILNLYGHTNTQCLQILYEIARLLDWPKGCCRMYVYYWTIDKTPEITGSKHDCIQITIVTWKLHTIGNFGMRTPFIVEWFYFETIIIIYDLFYRACVIYLYTIAYVRNRP